MLHQGPQTHEQDDTVHQPNTMCVFTVSLTTYSGSSDIVTENCHLPFIPLFPFVWAPPLCSSLNVQLVSFMLVSAPLIMCNSCLIPYCTVWTNRWLNAGCYISLWWLKASQAISLRSAFILLQPNWKKVRKRLRFSVKKNPIWLPCWLVITNSGAHTSVTTS